MSDVFYNAELEDEHYTNHDNFRWTRTKKQDREDKLKEIMENGIGASYHHNPQKVFNVYDNVLTVGDIQDVANAGASMETGNLISHIACFLS